MRYEVIIRTSDGAAGVWECEASGPAEAKKKATEINVATGYPVCRRSQIIGVRKIGDVQR